MAELSGAQVLEDKLLDIALDRELAARSLSVSPELIEAERSRLLEAIGSEAGLPVDSADRTLARIRASRGLGPVRFPALLARNAKLRRLVQDDLAPDPREVALELEIALGAKAVAILVLVQDEKEAATIRASLLAEGGLTPARLSTFAAARSLDSSASNGGRIGPIHPADPRVNASLRDPLRSLPIGELSAVLAVEDGYALLMVESRTEPLPESPAALERAQSAVRARDERLAMERLARRLITDTFTRLNDPSLRWSWQQRLPSGEPR